MEKVLFKQKAVFIAWIILLSNMAFFIIFHHHERVLAVGSDLFQTGTSILSGYWLLRKYLKRESKDCAFWLFLSLTVFSYGIGIIFWDYYQIFLNVEVPFPSISDLFFLLMYVFILIAYVYFMYINRKVIRLGQMVYDTIIVISAGTAISWELVFKPLLHSLAEQGILYQVVSVIYPMGNLAILFVLISFFYSFSMKFSSKVLLFIFLGTSSFLTADTWFLYLFSEGNYASGHLVDLLWVFGILMIGISPFYADGEIFKINEQVHPVKMDRKKWGKYLFSLRLWMPSFGVFFLFLVLAMQGRGINSITIGTLVSVLLTIFRQIYTLAENEILLKESIDLNKELEFKVQQRTKQLLLKNEQLSEAIQKEEYMAFHDPLTELPNRRYFEKYLQRALKYAKENNEKLAIFYLDLDRYKMINDILGHSIGDILLQQVAQRLSSCIGDAGMISRHGGDEFLVMLPNTDENMAAAAADDILGSLREVFKVGEHELFITSSIGISLYPDNGKELEVLTKRADAALYAAKKAFRNKRVFYHSSMSMGTIADLDLEKDLRVAVENEEFIVVYQPLVHVQSGNIKGVEALIRWNHPQKGVISPEKFIPIAEESGMIIPIGLWILKTACRQWRKWADRGMPPITIAVNFSIRQFFHPNFLDQIEAVLTETKMDPSYLELEITENTFVSNDASILFEELKKKGIKISIDDFGTGYSSLQYLKRLPINKLKIDQSFIRDIPANSNDVAIVETIIAMAHHMNLEVVAEGVESEEQLKFLHELHCHFAQGYLFSKPVAAEDFEVFYTVNA